MKKLTYVVFDTETATLPFVNQITDDPELKKKIAVIRSIIYDMGWVVIDRMGNTLKKCSYLVQEVFCDDQLFNTAYYAWKRPLYMDKLTRGEIEIKPWADIISEFLQDVCNANFVGAYNTAFDQRALNFTDEFLANRENPAWMKKQYSICEFIIGNAKSKKKEKEVDHMHLNFRDQSFPNFDVWGMACEYLLNCKAYKNNCLEYDMISKSGEFFTTSAESSFRFLCDKYEFEEEHTALADAEIEAYILSKILRRHAVTQGIQSFPFRKLGTTVSHITESRGVRENWARKVLATFYARLECYEEGTAYYTHVLNNIKELESFILIKFN